MANLIDKPNYRVVWSQADLARMTDMLGHGRTIPEVAKVLGRSQEAVRNRARAAGLLPKRPRKPASSP